MKASPDRYLDDSEKAVNTVKTDNIDNIKDNDDINDIDKMNNIYDTYINDERSHPHWITPLY